MEFAVTVAYGLYDTTWLYYLWSVDEEGNCRIHVNNQWKWETLSILAIDNDPKTN